MTIAELIAKLQTLPPTAKLECADGSSLDIVYYHAGMQRVSVDTEDMAVKHLADGWREV